MKRKGMIQPKLVTFISSKKLLGQKVSFIIVNVHHHSHLHDDQEHSCLCLVVLACNNMMMPCIAFSKLCNVMK